MTRVHKKWRVPKSVTYPSAATATRELAVHYAPVSPNRVDLTAEAFAVSIMIAIDRYQPLPANPLPSDSINILTENQRVEPLSLPAGLSQKFNLVLETREIH